MAVGAIINERTAEERDADIVKREIKIKVPLGGVFDGDVVTDAGICCYRLIIGCFERYRSGGYALG